MGDQRRRSKSRGCQKEQEEGEERVGGCVRVYTEWVWPLFTVHSGERERGDKQGMRTEVGDGRCRRRSKEKKRKKQMTDEMSR